MSPLVVDGWRGRAMPSTFSPCHYPCLDWTSSSTRQHTQWSVPRFIFVSCSPSLTLTLATTDDSDHAHPPLPHCWRRELPSRSLLCFPFPPHPPKSNNTPPPRFSLASSPTASAANGRSSPTSSSSPSSSSAPAS